MSAIENAFRTAAGAPTLGFAVEDAASAKYTAVPTLTFALRIDAEGPPVRAILLDVQIQIAARQRGYGAAEQERLLELFGAPERWGTTLRTVPWLRTTLVVGAFTQTTRVECCVPCTYDLEVIAARYLASLDDGAVPLEFLFSGSVFFLGPTQGLQMARIGWDQEAHYRLPVAVWRETMDRHFRSTAWLRLGEEPFRRLCAFKARHAFTSWDAAIDALLAGAGDERGEGR